MSIVLIEGWDHLTAALTGSKGWGTVFSSVNAGRLGGQAGRMTSSSGAQRTTQKSLPATITTIVCGFAFRWNSISGTTARSFLNLRNGATNTVRLELLIGTTNTVRVLNSGGTVIAAGSFILTQSAWVYIEIKAVINGASGTVEVHINGGTEIAQTTANFGSSGIDNIQLLSPDTTLNSNNDFDDMYVADDGTFRGDCRVETVFPIAEGANSDFTPSTGTDNSALVDETTPNDDTDYVQSSTVNHVDTYDFTSLASGGGGVKAVAVNVYAKKDDAGARSLASVVRQSGSNNAGTSKAISTSYVTYQQIYNQDPASADWTPTSVNAAEFGHKVAV